MLNEAFFLPICNAISELQECLNLQEKNQLECKWAHVLHFSTSIPTSCFNKAQSLSRVNIYIPYPHGTPSDQMLNKIPPPPRSVGVHFP
jgi:hypothetical protein